MLAGGFAYKILFKDLGSSTVLMVYVPISSSARKTAEHKARYDEKNVSIA